MAKDLKIYKKNPDGSLSLGIGQVPQFISGIDILTQIVLLAILENPGRDVFNPSTGSGVRELIGQYDSVNEDELKTEFTRRIKKITEEIINEQTGTGVPAEERLKNLTIMKLSVNVNTSELVADILIENQAGQIARVKV